MYTTRQDVLAHIPEAFLTQALSDDPASEGESPGIWESIQAVAEAEVDGYLGARFAVPFADPVPDVVRMACLMILLETLYSRRGSYGDANPYTARAEAVRSKLGRIGKGEEPLTYSAAPGRASVMIVGEDAAGVSRYGFNS